MSIKFACGKIFLELSECEPADASNGMLLANPDKRTAFTRFSPILHTTHPSSSSLLRVFRSGELPRQ